MRKLKKSELKRVYGGKHSSGDSAESTESVESTESTESAESVGGTSS